MEGKMHVWEQSHSSIYLPLMQFCESKVIKRSCDFWHDWINSEVLFESIRLLSPWNKSSMFTLLPYVKRMHLKISWWVNLFFKKAVGGGGSYRNWHSVAPTSFFSSKFLITFLILKICSWGRASFYWALFWKNLIGMAAPLLDAKVTAFECKGSMFHMCAELTEEAQLPSLLSI